MTDVTKGAAPLIVLMLGLVLSAVGLLGGFLRDTDTAAPEPKGVIPPIDVTAPGETETATFALG
jgi:hypothetical protein